MSWKNRRIPSDSSRHTLQLRRIQKLGRRDLRSRYHAGTLESRCLTADILTIMSSASISEPNMMFVAGSILVSSILTAGIDGSSLNALDSRVYGLRYARLQCRCCLKPQSGKHTPDPSQ